VFDITLAPLRDRPDDILPLSEAFLDDISGSFGRPPAGLSSEARAIVLAYHWPGNVRQLRNLLERAAILSEGGLIQAEHLALPRPADSSPALTAHPNDLAQVERQTIAQVLRECQWNKTKAAHRLGLTRTRLYLRIRKYGLE